MQNRAEAISGMPDCLSPGVDIESDAARVAVDSAQVSHRSVRPHESVMVAVRDIGKTDNFSGLIDPVGATVVAAECSQVSEHAALPDKGVVGQVTGEIRGTDDLAAIIDRDSDSERPSKRAKIDHMSTAPEKRIHGGNSGCGIRDIIGERKPCYQPRISDATRRSGVRAA